MMWMRGLTVKRVSERDIKNQSDQLVMEKELIVMHDGVSHTLTCTPGLEEALEHGFLCVQTTAMTKVSEGATLSRAGIFILTAYFQEKALLYKHTGITHSAAFANPKALTSFAEDLYQMSACYKILGSSVSQKSTRDILLVSGRVDQQLLMFAIKAGVQIVISRTGVTDKAFDMAEAYGVSVVGFARGTRFNIYTHPKRICL